MAGKNNSAVHKILNSGIALVWAINGLFCKLLNMVPRHDEIVQRVLGEYYFSGATQIMGFLEVLMAVWILSGFRQRLNTGVQVVVIAIMNILEFTLAPDLLLFGRANAIVAGFFIALIIVNEVASQKTISK